MISSLAEYLQSMRRTIIISTLSGTVLLFLTLALAAYLGGIDWWKGFVPMAAVAALIGLAYHKRTDINVEWRQIDDYASFEETGVPDAEIYRSVKLLTKTKPNEIKERTQPHGFREVKRAAVIVILGCTFVAYMATMFSAMTSSPTTPNSTPATYTTFSYNSITPAPP